MKTNHWLARSMPKLLTPRLFTASAPLGTPTSISDTSLEMSLSSRVPVRRSLAASRWRPAPRVPVLCTAVAAPAVSTESLKRKILRLSALTDRGQLLFQQKACVHLPRWFPLSQPSRPEGGES